jgi:Flp pilus assembly protein TadD
VTAGPAPSPSPSASAIQASAVSPSPDPGATRITAKPSSEPEAESLSARIERELAFASMDSIARAEALLAEAKGESSEFGRAALYVAQSLYAFIYKDLKREAPPADPPLLHPAVRAIDEASRGRLAPESVRQSGRLPALLSTLVILRDPQEGARAQALAELSRLEAAGLRSLLVPYLRAYVAEADGRSGEALGEYEASLALDPAFYPGEVGKARCLLAAGRSAEAAPLLLALTARLPDDQEIIRLTGRALYEQGRYMAASPYVQAVLRADPTDDAFIIMRAHILIIGGAYIQAAPLLNAYATKHPRDPLYLYLRTLYAWKEQKSRDQALASAESGISLYPDDLRFLRLKAQILLEGSLPGSPERADAVEALQTILAVKPDDADALALLCSEAAGRGDYQVALALLGELRAVDPSFSDYALMVAVALGSGKAEQGLAWAAEWAKAEPDSEDAAAAQIRALIESGKGPAALERINERLATRAASRTRSVLLYYRSRLQKDPDAVLSDLRASLMEDPANLDALLSMFDSYFAQKDYKKARFYIRQAQSVSAQDQRVAGRMSRLEAVAGQ